jgi:SAM-dependent methyltransferase
VDDRLKHHNVKSEIRNQKLKMPKPAWQLPAGVTRGVWDYSQTGELAENEDAYFAEHPLFDFDAQVLRRYFEPPGVVADLGCGAGRALLPLVRRGLSAIAIDLSQSMLEAVRRRARSSACGRISSISIAWPTIQSTTRCVSSAPWG